MYCDIGVFAWLMAFVKYPEGPSTPQLTHSNVLPTLIASNFLQMGQLVPRCIAYIAENMVDLVHSGTDIASLSELLLRDIAQVGIS